LAAASCPKRRSKPAVYPNLSNNPENGRLDPEGIKISNNGLSVFISDEYGPYVYQFDRLTGARIRAAVARLQ
jgi:hypothetical protein